MSEKLFIDVDHSYIPKSGQIVSGDFFLSKKLEGENRIISVLADGLGSGIKASVLATLSSTMALKFISSNMDIRKTSKLIMETLPVCQTRKIGYSTFTIIDCNLNGETRIIEYDNPAFVLMRKDKVIDVSKQQIKMNLSGGRPINVYFSEFKIQMDDRIVICSDGVTQSGIGTKSLPMGWGDSGLRDYLKYLIKSKPEVSARNLAHSVVCRATSIDSNEAKDDTSCGVLYVRKPRELTIFTGPPFNENNDKELFDKVKNCKGKKIICGGTTSQIIAKNLGLEISLNMEDGTSEVPPTSNMKGFELLTEGTITLSKVVSLLEFGDNLDTTKSDAAIKLFFLLLNSDIINFVVGLSINKAHQDPSLVNNLDLRKNIIMRIKKLLEEKYLKKVNCRFL